MIMTEGLNFTGIPADKFQKNVRIVFMRIILSRCVIVDVWLKRSFYTTGCEKHIATFAIRLIKHFSSTGKHVFIPSDKMWQIRHFQYIKIQTWLRGLGDKQKKLNREKTNETTELLFIIVEQRKARGAICLELNELGEMRYSSPINICEQFFDSQTRCEFWQENENRFCRLTCFNTFGLFGPHSLAQ